MAPHSSTLAWKIPWMEEPGRPQSMGALRVGQDSATSLSLFLSCIGEGKGNPRQCSCLENLRDGGASWAAVYGVAQSRTRLNRLSSSYYIRSLFSYYNSSWIKCVLTAFTAVRFDSLGHKVSLQWSAWHCLAFLLGIIWFHLHLCLASFDYFRVLYG